MELLQFSLGLIAVASMDLGVSASRTINLRPDEYRLSVGQPGGNSCTRCDELYHLINTNGQEVLSLMEIEDKFGEPDDDGSVSSCCIGSLTQEIELINARIRHERHRMQQRVSLSAQLIKNRDLQLPTHEGFTVIHPSEWSFGGDVNFCEAFNPAFCNFTTHRHNIMAPFGGYFTINLRVAWDSSLSQRVGEEYAVRLERIRRSHKTIIGYAGVPGKVGSTVPVLAATIHQSMLLRRADRLAISVTHKDRIVDGRSIHTFLVLSGESR